MSWRNSSFATGRPFICQVYEGSTTLVPDRALPRYEPRSADLAFVAWDRWEAGNPEDELDEAPDSLVEALSKSNSADALPETKHLSLANGCREFWAVCPKLMLIEVSAASGRRMFRLGKPAPSVVIPGHAFAVADLMSGHDTDPVFELPE